MVGNCKRLYPTYILMALVGIFFILLGFYWILVFWWSKINRMSSNAVSFSVVVTLWFVLCLLSVAITSALTTQIVQYRNETIYIYKYDMMDDDNIMKDNDDCKRNSQIVALPAVGSILVLWTVQMCVFLVNACCSMCGR